MRLPAAVAPPRPDAHEQSGTARGGECETGASAATEAVSPAKTKTSLEWKTGAKDSKETGKVPWSVYREYATVGSRRYAAALLVFAGVAQTMVLSKDLVLARWSDAAVMGERGAAAREGHGQGPLSAPPPRPNHPPPFLVHNITGAGSLVAGPLGRAASGRRGGGGGGQGEGGGESLLGEYAAVSAGAVVFFFLRSAALALLCARAALLLHAAMVDAVLAAPLHLFERTPVGQLTNRFGADTDALDFALIGQLNLALDMVCTLLGAAVLMVSQEPSLALAFAALLWVYARVRDIFAPAATALKRLDAQTKSPVYSLLSQALDGLSTIRPMRLQSSLLAAAARAIDTNTACFLAWAHLNRWLGLRLDLMGAGVIGLTAGLGVVSSERLGAGGAGLLLTLAIAVTRSLSGSVRTVTQLEMQFSTVQRVLAFARTQPEADPHAEDGGAGGGEWPRLGRIRFRGVTCRYEGGGGEAALDGVNMQVEHGMCVGVCGRTGSGKSSLLLALGRVLRCESGSIEIDGCDIANLPLRRLRSGIAVIPQDPVQVAATVREAVDPLCVHPDAAILDMLHRVGLGHGRAFLKTPLLEGGANLSVGQRQLLCVARALLSRKTILAFDETWAHLDPAAAHTLRRILRLLRGRQTVLVVAHRLQDVAVCDHVMVMSEGRVAEQGKPHDLITDPDGAFSRLVKELDEDGRAAVMALAQETAEAPDQV